MNVSQMTADISKVRIRISKGIRSTGRLPSSPASKEVRGLPESTLVQITLRNPSDKSLKLAVLSFF